MNFRTDPYSRTNPSSDQFARRIAVGSMTLPYRVITFPFKMITFPFDMVGNAFHELGNATAPKPLNYIVGSPFYLMELAIKMPTLPFKLICLPFDMIIASIEQAAEAKRD